MTAYFGVGQPLEIAFWRRIDRSAGPDACWTWRLRPAFNGYGYFRSRQAHRIAYELTFGPIPAGLLVCHHCDNRICANPSHLFLGTIADNNHDMTAKGRVRHGSAHRNAKLNEADVLVIRALRGRVSSTELAGRFGVSARSIRHAWTGATWRSIELVGDGTLFGKAVA